MTVARVSRINVTPVKSLRLHHPDAVELGPDGGERGGRIVAEGPPSQVARGKTATSGVVRAALKGN